MRIEIITPAPPHSRSGNRVTAVRWARILRESGHQVSIRQEYHGGQIDLLIALHASKSFVSIARFRSMLPAKPLIVGLAGTDLYRDLAESAEPMQALRWANRIVTLQPLAKRELPGELAAKTTTIYQSAEPVRGVRKSTRLFDVCVVAHLRDVKDPLRAAYAVRDAPTSSRIRISLAGAALDPDYAESALTESRQNGRFRWLGELPRWNTRRLIARSRLLVVSSSMEGGANVISEALASSTPILSTRIPGSVGLLGDDYPGYFPVRGTEELRGLLLRAESDSGFYAELQSNCDGRRWIARPDREMASWVKLLNDL